MADMQVTYNGNDLDNGSWRTIDGTIGDDMGSDNRRVVAVDFTIEADDAETLQSRYQSTIGDFVARDARLTVTLDTDASSYLVDMSPHDGIHNKVSSTLGVMGASEQTIYSLACRLFVIAEVITFNAALGQTSYDGLVNGLRKITSYNQGRIEDRAVIATFETTYDSNGKNGPYTISSVADDGSGNAEFTLAETPVAFSAGMKLKVVGATAYNGVHTISAIDTGAKTVTTDTAYSASATGTCYIGVLKTGEEWYQAARSSILTDILGTDSDGTRNSTTGLCLVTEKQEDTDESQNSITVLLQSSFEETELANTPEARDLRIRITNDRPRRWHTGGGTTPRMLTVEVDVFIDRDTLVSNGDNLAKLFDGQIKSDVEAYIKTETGENSLRRLSRSFRSDVKMSMITAVIEYQARNTLVRSYSEKDESREDDDSIHYRVGEYDYEQRPDGLPPKFITRTVTREAYNLIDIKVPTPKASGGAVYVPKSSGTAQEGPFDTEDGQLYVQAKSVVFKRMKYKQGNSPAGVIKP